VTLAGPPAARGRLRVSYGARGAAIRLRGALAHLASPRSSLQAMAVA